MSKSENQKKKLLYILKFFYEETDEEHTLTVKKLLQSLNAMGFQLQDEQFMMILGQFRILELIL